MFITLVVQQLISAQTQTGDFRYLRNLTPATSTLPLSFESNHGQTDQRVKYRSRGSRYELFLTDSEAVIALAADDKGTRRAQTRAPVKPSDAPSIVRMKLKGAKSTAIQGEDMLPEIVNYIAGSDPRTWRTGVETYGRVRYAGVYPGIDLVFYGNQGQLEFDFVVAPRSDVNRIRLELSGIVGLHLDAEKNLTLDLVDRELTLHRPVAYQEIDGIRRPVNADFRIGANNTISFALGKYDASRKLVVDPILAYSTYLGGDFFDGVRALAVDQSGNAYVVGTAASCDFPTTQGTYEPVLPDCTSGSQGVIFVTKINPQGTSLVYSTFVTNGDVLASGSAQAIALDESGNVYVAGKSGVGLPVTSGAFQPVNNAAANGGINGFVFKLNVTGTALLYSSYIGGDGSFGGDSVSAIAIDSDGEAYLAGTALSTDFPTTTGAFQTVDMTPGEPVNFVSKVNASGSALLYSTYLGGNGVINAGSAPTSQANGIAVDGAGSAYVVGTTADESFPVTPGAFQTSYSTDSSNLAGFRFTGYVTKLDLTGAQEVYSSFLGGSYTSGAQAVAVDSSGNAYVTGWTAGDDITTPVAFQTVAPGFDAYVVKINPSGIALTYATYLGGSIMIGGLGPGDAGFGIAVDPSGDAYVAGQARSPDFPVTNNAIQSTLVGGNPAASAFLSELNPAGSELLFSTYIGGSYAGDVAWGVGLDGLGDTFVAGLTSSFSFPTTVGAFQTQNNASDQGTGFVSKFTIPQGGKLLVHDFAVSLNPPSASISNGQDTSTTVTVTPSNGFYEPISFSCSGTPAGAYCSFSQGSLTPGTSVAVTTLTVSTSTVAGVAIAPGFPIIPVICGAAICCLFGKQKRKTLKFGLLGMILGTLLSSGCGGGTNTGGATNPNSFVVTITASAPSTQHTATFAVTAN